MVSMLYEFNEIQKLFDEGQLITRVTWQDPNKYLSQVFSDTNNRLITYIHLPDGRIMEYNFDDEDKEAFDYAIVSNKSWN